MSFNATATTTSGGPWLGLQTSAGTTPGTVSVGVNPAGLGVGVYNGSVTVTASGATNAPVTVPVTLTVSSTPYLTVSPTSLAFYFQTGSAAPASQTLSLGSSGAAVNVSISTAITSGGSSWLVASPLSGTAPGSISVSVNPSGLPVGTYTGSVIITAGGASNSPQTVPVTLTVTSNPLLSVSATSLAFNYQIGAAAPASQSLTVTSSGAALAYSVTASTASGGAWLAAGPLTGTTHGSVTVAVSTSGLPPGLYTGSIMITAAAGNSPRVVPVVLTVSNNPLLTVAPASLSFAFQIGFSSPSSQTVSVSSTGSPLAFTLSAATSSGGNWLFVTPGVTATPGTFSVGVNPAGLAAGSYTGSVTVTAGGAANSPLTIPVNFIVANTALLVVSPGALAFTLPLGSTTTTIQNASVTSTDGTGLGFTVSATTSSGGNWLLVGPLFATTPINLNISVNPTGLSAGTYTGSVVVTSGAVPNSPQTLAVTLTITPSAAIAVAPGALSFTQTTGGPAPPAQALAVSSTGASLNFLAAVAAISGGNWLSVTPNSGVTPGSVSVSVNGAALAPGTYAGSVTITSTGAANSPQTIPVTLTVTGQALNVSPGVLAFSYQIGSPVPAAQALSVSITGINASFSASVSTASGGNWLSVSPTTGTTPASVSVSVNPVGLIAGTYNGAVSIASTGASNSPQTVNVVFTVTSAPVVVPSVGAVTNAASFAPTAISPGLIFTIFGTNIGPADPASLRVTGGVLDTSLADTQVLLDGIRAPLIYVSSTQISAIAPYEVAGRFSTRMQVQYKGVTSNPIELRVVDTAPGIFTTNMQGNGQGAILNQDFGLNSATNRARKGSFVMIYATGEGQTNPPGVNGAITGTLLRKPLQSVSVTIGGQPAEVAYAGAAPTLVAGVLQVNARIPENVTSGAAVPVVLTIGNASSQTAVTLAIQ